MKLNARLERAWEGQPQVVRVGDAPLPMSVPPGLEYVSEGDILWVDPRNGFVRVLYRRMSRHNALLLTEACNSHCIMCSQPPRPNDGGGVDLALAAIPLMAPDTVELGITGGEPTLLGDRFIEVLAACKRHLPATAIHVLSNGRMFAYLSFARAVAGIEHPDMMFGIPLYSDLAGEHDFVVQAKGAYDQTIRGLLNLARCKVPVEVRVVLEAPTVRRLPQLAEFIARNLPFAAHVALMGLEPTGYARPNLASLAVEPAAYEHKLRDAVDLLAGAGLRVSIYNLPLCALDQTLWPFARKSISDWKNEYVDACAPCAVRADCCGFFASALRGQTPAVRPVAARGAVP